jgi:glycosyltransferase involved in cell wall biosynthesis
MIDQSRPTPMRINFILPTIGMSGGIRVVAIYAMELARRGHSVKLILQPPNRVPFKSNLSSLLRGGGWSRQPKLTASYFESSGLDYTILETPRPVIDSDVPDADVIVATWWETAEWVRSLHPAKGARVYFVQGHEVFSYERHRCESTYRMPFHKIVVAPWLKDVMLSQYGDRTVDVVPNSVDKRQFFAQPRGKQPLPTVGLLYATSGYKGLDISLAALKEVRKQFTSLQIVSFGAEPVLASLPLPNGSQYSQLPPQDRIRDLYARCDVWLTASRTEGFNLPAMEAMACRTPVVATRTGWPEGAVRSGWNGVLVDVDDLAGVVNGTTWVLSQSEAKWKELSDNAYSTVATSSWSASASLFEDALNHARIRAARGEIDGNG